MLNEMLQKAQMKIGLIFTPPVLSPLRLNVMHKTLASRETAAADGPTRKRGEDST